MVRRGWCRPARAAGVTLAACAVFAVVPALPASARRIGAPAIRVRCVTTKHRYDRLAVRLAHDIAARLARHPYSTVGMETADGHTGITCTYHAAEHFIAASVIKVTILAALLRRAQEQHRRLTARERRLAWLMITQSDNAAATDLWNELGIPAIQHFLDLAGMRQTELAYAWGLSLLTAHDEAILLRLLSARNPVLDKASRVYARYLMGHVIPGQRWGVPAGTPRGVDVHVKNGWLPWAGSWEINSVGIFTTTHRVYLMAFLTHGNPTMAAGIATIEAAAEVIHRDLHPHVPAAIGPSQPGPGWGVPDERPPAGAVPPGPAA